jgi:hypothetical protein
MAGHLIQNVERLVQAAALLRQRSVFFLHCIPKSWGPIPTAILGALWLGPDA